MPGTDVLGNRGDLLDAVHALRVHPVLVGTRSDFVRTLEGDVGVERLVHVLSPVARDYLNGRVDPFSTRPVGPLLEIDRALLAGPFRNDPRWFRRLGALGGENLMDSFLRTFLLASGDSERALAYLARLFGRFYQGGEALVVERAEAGAVLQAEGVVLPAHFCAHVVPGWVERALRLGGARRPAALHVSCLHRGEDACRWSLDFS